MEISSARLKYVSYSMIVKSNIRACMHCYPGSIWKFQIGREFLKMVRQRPFFVLISIGSITMYSSIRQDFGIV